MFKSVTDTQSTDMLLSKIERGIYRVHESIESAAANARVEWLAEGAGR